MCSICNNVSEYFICDICIDKLHEGKIIFGRGNGKSIIVREMERLRNESNKNEHEHK